MTITIAPIRIPHGRCHEGCPWCTSSMRRNPRPLPEPDVVEKALTAARPSNDPPQLALVGADFSVQPEPERSALFDAARAAVRSGRASSLRLQVSPNAVLRASMRFWRVSGVSSVEVLGWSIEQAALRRMGIPWNGERVLDALRALDGAGIVPGVHIIVDEIDLPPQDFAQSLRAAGAQFVRLFPRLVLEGQEHRSTLSLNDAIEVSAKLCDALDEVGVKVARIGMQPMIDLVETPRVAGGPHHPALRSLVESQRWKRRVRAELARLGCVGGSWQVFINPADETSLRGHHNQTIPELRKRFRLRNLDVRTDPLLPRAALVVRPAGATFQEMQSVQ